VYQGCARAGARHAAERRLTVASPLSRRRLQRSQTDFRTAYWSKELTSLQAAGDHHSVKAVRPTREAQVPELTRFAQRPVRSTTSATVTGIVDNTHKGQNGITYELTSTRRGDRVIMLSCFSCFRGAASRMSSSPRRVSSPTNRRAAGLQAPGSHGLSEPTALHFWLMIARAPRADCAHLEVASQGPCDRTHSAALLP
jgi:hypothetical protein